MRSSQRPTVVIVGRPNVGKSTLFNRISHSRRSIVGNEPGITRDRIRLEVEWQGRPFDLIDTGGMTFGESEEFPQLINEQVRAAVAEAAHVILVIDGRAEISRTDRELADFLRRSGRPVSLAVNKCDTGQLDDQAAQFHELGIGAVFPVSAEHGRGIEELLEQVAAGFPPPTVATAAAEDGASERTAPEPESAKRPIRVAIIGRPNAGKSTLLNRLTGTHRAIVSATPGTTRDAVDEEVEHRGVRYQFVDTAGIRRKGKTKLMAEKLSVVMAQRHLRMADVALLMIDAVEGVTNAEATIAGYAHEAGKAVILVVNKWDQNERTKEQDFQEKIRRHLKFLDYAPIIFISALTGARVERLFPLVRKVHRAASRRVGTGELNRFLQSVDLERATTPGARKPKIYYVTQASVRPPTFVFFTSSGEKFHFGFERFLVNQLRRAFDFEGTPLVIKCRPKGS
jgi:GTP-binding protein